MHAGVAIPEHAGLASSADALAVGVLAFDAMSERILRFSMHAGLAVALDAGIALAVDSLATRGCGLAMNTGAAFAFDPGLPSATHPFSGGVAALYSSPGFAGRRAGHTGVTRRLDTDAAVGLD